MSAFAHCGLLTETSRCRCTLVGMPLTGRTCNLAAFLITNGFSSSTLAYCSMSWSGAKLGQGRFDLDYVVRMCDVVFLRRGVVITEDLQSADEVQITFGKQKTSAGGEVRSHTASTVARYVCVVRVLAALVSQRGDQFS